MIRYDGEVVYSESGSGIKANSRLLFNEAQVSAIKSIINGEVKRQLPDNTVYVVKNSLLDEYGKLEQIFVFAKLSDAENYVLKHPRAVIMPRKIIKHGEGDKYEKA